MKKIAIGADHAGFLYKTKVIEFLKAKEFDVLDFGTHNESSVDYPDFAHPVGNAVSKNEVILGIVICGSGNGVNITVNKYENVRSALCWTKEIAVLARQHNNANLLALPARFTSEQQCLEIVEAFLYTNFEGGRHATRVDKIKRV